MGKQVNDCFFFAYKSGLHSLQEVFSMGEARANLSGAPWYVGWSTCYDEETRKLREYYDRPYFLPNTAESDMVDWIFMGGPGPGAHMHVSTHKYPPYHPIFPKNYKNIGEKFVSFDGLNHRFFNFQQRR